MVWWRLRNISSKISSGAQCFPLGQKNDISVCISSVYSQQQAAAVITDDISWHEGQYWLHGTKTSNQWCSLTWYSKSNHFVASHWWKVAQEHGAAHRALYGSYFCGRLCQDLVTAALIELTVVPIRLHKKLRCMFLHNKYAIWYIQHNRRCHLFYNSFSMTRIMNVTVRCDLSFYKIALIATCF